MVYNIVSLNNSAKEADKMPGEKELFREDAFEIEDPIQKYIDALLENPHVIWASFSDGKLKIDTVAGPIEINIFIESDA